MRSKNVLFQLVYRFIWVVISIIATVTTFLDHLPENKGGDGRPVALFFTSWSVWLVTVIAVIVFAFTLKSYLKGEREAVNNPCPLLKFSGSIMIFATFVVGGFVLGEFFTSFGAVFKHFLLPIITILDAVFFDPKNSYRVSYPFLGVILPLLYWIVIILRIVIKRKDSFINPIEWANYYPYGFTNLDNGKSLGGLIGLLGGILVGLILVGFIFWLIDKLSIENKKVKFDKTVNDDSCNDIIYLVKNKINK